MKDEMIVLIISHSADIHVDEVEKHLLAKGQQFLRLNLDHFPRDYNIEFSVECGNKICYELIHKPSGIKANNRNIKSVWVRKRAPFCFVSEDLCVQEKQFAEQEVEHLFNGFLSSLECYWMSHPKAIRAAQWKVEQLSRANKFGFKTPDTLITNNPAKVIDFYNKHNKRIITKPLSDAALAADKVDHEDLVSCGLYTTLLTSEQIGHIEAVKEFPCNFQQYIEKQFELRVTIIGNDVFTAKIDSQADERTTIDVRDFSAEIDYDAWHLPVEVASQCLEYVHSYGLQYGAMDLIYTPDNEFVFLENNPGGQFWYVEQLVPELRMMEKLADCLTAAGGTE